MTDLDLNSLKCRHVYAMQGEYTNLYQRLNNFLNYMIESQARTFMIAYSLKDLRYIGVSDQQATQFMVDTGMLKFHSYKITIKDFLILYTYAH